MEMRVGCSTALPKQNKDQKNGNARIFTSYANSDFQFWWHLHSKKEQSVLNHTMTTLKKFWMDIKVWRASRLCDRVVLLNDNATTCSAGATQESLQKFKWECGPNLFTASTLHPATITFLFLSNKTLGGERFASDDDMQDAVSMWLQEIGQHFKADGIDKLVTWYEKFLESILKNWQLFILFCSIKFLWICVCL